MGASVGSECVVVVLQAEQQIARCQLSHGDPGGCVLPLPTENVRKSEVWLLLVTSLTHRDCRPSFASSTPGNSPD